MARANKGGEVGVNGEFYNGGRFLPNNPDRAKVEGSKPRGTRKLQIEPGVYVPAPVGFVSVYGSLLGVATYDANAKMFTLFHNAHPVWSYLGSQSERDANEVRSEFQRLADMFNSGERIVPAT